MKKQIEMKFKKNPWGRGYVSTDMNWMIHPEGTATWWYAVELGADTYPIEETKQYFRSYSQCKDHVNWKIAQQAERLQKTEEAFTVVSSFILKGIAS